ncbi:hypothetical protein Emtol_2230 [Emticicia oligotrophica DSM 17448]|uniref:SnoaL-like domain-containing protein n=1 Tax=Emticicia oligotrophica (strain DSM 17448 / CIP 109782 / MTCC 6937 / GPTSA100-15) TaxID=929562 RepID=A0ABM5N1R7_EMTOG|nr:MULTISPECIES: nuclear transport factor 2 family protein [Emticicia]AFK03368.1 hypothetical protein Emtol_2230 [Emticicia oligotrophica DSM 17448]
MKKYFLLLVLSSFLTMTYAQKTTEQRLQEIEDRLALKALVDEFSVLADRKDIVNQMLLFTEDAKVESVNNGQAIVLSGKKQIGDAFEGFLSLFEVVYHINGQQTITITGDKATGIAYCSVSLIGVQNGKRMKNDMGVIYNDEYVKIKGKWLIANRKSNFTWRNSQLLSE